MNLSKNAEYTSNLSSDESEGRGHRKRKQKRFSDSEADGKDVQLCAYCGKFMPNSHTNEIKPSCIDTKSVNVYFSILAQRCYHCLYLFDNKYV